MSANEVSSASDTPAAALGGGDDHFVQYLNRTIMLLGLEAVQALRTKTVAVAGCGGIGGAGAILLARMGVGGFTLADPGLFDPPDINRQWAADCGSLGKNKATTYAEQLRAINPSVRLKVFTEGVTEANVETFLSGADVLIDCMDIAVDHGLRARLYQAARARSLYCWTAPMLGFGAIIVAAAPDGIPMEVVYGRALADSVDGAKLPPGLRDLVVPEHLEAIETYLPLRKAPSISVSPALAATLISTEIALLFLGPATAGWRPPRCLPEVMVVDPIRTTFRVLPIQELLKPRAQAATDPIAASAAAQPAAAGRPERLQALATVGHNVNLLPHGAARVDLFSDSWGERARPDLTAETAETAPGPLTEHLRGLYGYKHVVPVFRGRFAEALLAKALIRPGAVVATNALFPTTRFHLESSGARLLEVGVPDAYDGASPTPFKGNLDLAALRAAVEREAVQYVYVELCANALGGHPVSLANLRAVHELASAHGIGVLLDTTRAFENAGLIRSREPGQADRSLAAIVRELCGYSDACAASLAKDFRSPVGGFVGTNHLDTFTRLRDLALLAYGSGLSPADEAALARALAVSPEAPGAAAGRVAAVERLHTALESLGVPVLCPPGGHAVFVDAAACLPHLGPADHRPMALANALFAAGGVRTASHMGSPTHQALGLEIVRLAVPVGELADTDLGVVVAAFKEVMGHREQVAGLEQVSAPPGMVGEFAATYRPVAVRERAPVAL